MGAFVHLIPEFKCGGVLSLSNRSASGQIRILYIIQLLFVFQEGMDHVDIPFRFPEYRGIAAGDTAGGQAYGRKKPVFPTRRFSMMSGIRSSAQAGETGIFRDCQHQFLKHAMGVSTLFNARCHEIIAIVQQYLPMMTAGGQHPEVQYWLGTIPALAGKCRVNEPVHDGCAFFFYLGHIDFCTTEDLPVGRTISSRRFPSSALCRNLQPHQSPGNPISASWSARYRPGPAMPHQTVHE